jgi:N4-gp56 family major capsid protein
MPDKNMLTTQRHGHPVPESFLGYLDYQMQHLPHNQFADKYDLKKNSGDIAIWERMSDPYAVTEPLEETSNPAPELIGRTTLSAQTQEYGAFTRVTEWQSITGEKSKGLKFTQWLGDQSSLSIDTLMRDVIRSSASNTTCSTGGTAFNVTDIDTAVQNMYSANTQELNGRMGAAMQQGTTPLSSGFVMIIHTNLMNTFRNLAGFVEVKNYAKPEEMYDGELGALNRVRIIMTTNAYYSGSNYYCPIIGRNAYGSVKIPGAEDLTVFTPPDIADPELHRWANYGWKTNFAGRILNDNDIHVMIGTAA